MKRFLISCAKPLAILAVAALAVGCASQKRLETENRQLKEQVKRLSDALASGDTDSIGLTEENARLAEELAGARAASAAKDSELDDMSKRLAAKGFDVSVSGGTVTVTLPAKILYASGSATITSSGKKKLKTLADELNGEFADFEIEVQGHTDNDPIKKTKGKYESNWELSYARAQKVLYYLVKSGRIKPQRIHASAYGEHHTAASNATATGKSSNRRVEIRLSRSAK